MDFFLKNRWVYHILIWIISFVVMCSVYVFSDPESVSWGDLVEIGAMFLLIIPLVYGNFKFKEKFYDVRKYFYYFSSVVLLVLVGIFFNQLLYQLFPQFTKRSFFQDFLNVSFLLCFTLGLQYLKRGIVNQYQLQELRAKTAEIELNSLKTQINPHFLFNTLNNIYAINGIDSAQGSDMIMELSEVMRYHLYASGLNDISLEEEVQLIDSYVALEKLRLRDNCKVEVHHTDINKSLKISPLILLPFIENAFKHGTDARLPCFIKVLISSTLKSVHLQVSNRIFPNKKTIKTGIGLENTKRRLELIYPNSHRLKIENNATTFDVSLAIQVST